MIEKTVLDYLNSKLDVPVLMELPEVPSESYPVFPYSMVLIEKVGERVTDRVHTASIALQSYSTQSLFYAAALDEQVREAMDGIVELDAVGASHMTSNYNFTDTRTKRYRYQCVFDITFV